MNFKLPLFAFLLFMTIGTITAQITPTFSVYTYTTDKSGKPQSVITNATGTDLTRVNGCNKPGNPCSTGFSGKSFPKDKNFSKSGPAIQFSVTPADQFTLHAGYFTADLRRSAQGTLDVQYAYSLDSGKTWKAQGVVQKPFNGGCGNYTSRFWDLEADSIYTTGKIMFRIYGYNADSKSGVLQVANVILTGTNAPTDIDGDGYVKPDDCNDTDPKVHPNAPEKCNGIDDNCNNQIDELLPLIPYYVDDNHDGFGESKDKFTLTCDTVAPDGYSKVLLPPLDIVITDSKVTLNPLLWSFTTQDFSVTGKGCRDVLDPAFSNMVLGLHSPAMFWGEGASVRQLFYVTDTLYPGGLGNGNNCAASGCEVIQGSCCMNYKLGSLNVDFFNAHCRFVRKFNLRSVVADNVVNGKVHDYWWEITRAKATHIVFGQEENTQVQKGYTIDTYLKKSNEKIDSVHKFFPGVITIADAAPIYSKATSNVNWNNSLAASTHADAVDQYFNLNDFPFSPYNDFPGDTVHMTSLMKTSIPTWLGWTRDKFPGKYIYVTQHSPGETFHPNVEVYPGTFFAGTYMVRLYDAYFRWNISNGNILIGGCYETLKSLIDKNNVGSLNYQMLEPIGNLFTEPATLLKIETESGILIYGVRSASGIVKLIALNYSGTDKKLPTVATVDGKYTIINWGSKFKYANGPTASKVTYNSYTPAGGMMKAWSEGYAEIVPVSDN